MTKSTEKIIHSSEHHDRKYNLDWWTSQNPSVPLLEYAYVGLIENPKLFRDILSRIEQDLSQPEDNHDIYPASSLRKISNKINDTSYLRTWWSTIVLQSVTTSSQVWETAITRYDAHKSIHPELAEENINWLKMLAASQKHLHDEYLPYEIMISELSYALCKQLIIDMYITEESSQLHH